MATHIRHRHGPRLLQRLLDARRTTNDRHGDHLEERWRLTTLNGHEYIVDNRDHGEARDSDRQGSST